MAREACLLPRHLRRERIVREEAPGALDEVPVPGRLGKWRRQFLPQR